MIKYKLLNFRTKHITSIVREYMIHQKCNNLDDPNFPKPLLPALDLCEVGYSGNEICSFSSIAETQDMLRSGQLKTFHSPDRLITLEQLTKLQKQRINHLQKYYRIFITEATEEHLNEQIEALQQREIDKGVGMFYHSKDLRHSFAGFPETSGSIDFVDMIAVATYTMNNILSQAGGVFLGTTNTSEFGDSPPEFGDSPTTSSVIGTTRNPFCPERTTGGSSGGAAAAVCAGIGHVGLANDEAGSIRIPASFTGTVGIKPATTMRFGITEANQYGYNCGQNNTSAGTLTRTISDAAKVWDILTNNHYHYSETIIARHFSLGHGFENMRIGYLPKFSYNSIDPIISSMVDKQIQCLKDEYGLNIELIEDLGFTDPEPYADILRRRGSITVVDHYGHAVKDPWILKCADSAFKLPQSAVMEAIAFKTAVQTDIRSFFKKYDYLITPTVAALPWEPADQGRPVMSDKLTDFSWNPYTYIFNWSNNAALSLPCGIHVTNEGQQLPIGLQIVVNDTTYLNNQDIHAGANDLCRLLDMAALIEYEINLGDPMHFYPSFLHLRYHKPGEC
jgi:Asp-tRNA(Asn)/Glu-tRNA(Gln) amidotransferase A subunit family amidase